MKKKTLLNPIEGVYYSHGKDYSLTVNPIAIRPRIRSENRIEWDDTTMRGTYFTFSQIDYLPSEENPTKIILKTPNGVIVLEKLTKEVYDEHVRSRVAYNPDFPSTEALQQYFLTTNFQAYY